MRWLRASKLKSDRRCFYCFPNRAAAAAAASSSGLAVGAGDFMGVLAVGAVRGVAMGASVSATTDMRLVCCTVLMPRLLSARVQRMASSIVGASNSTERTVTTNNTNSNHKLGTKNKIDVASRFVASIVVCH